MKSPIIYVDGERAKVVPECAGCGIIPDGETPPLNWQYNGYYGWLCPDCQEDYGQ